MALNTKQVEMMGTNSQSLKGDGHQLPRRKGKMVTKSQAGREDEHQKPSRDKIGALTPKQERGREMGCNCQAGMGDGHQKPSREGH